MAEQASLHLDWYGDDNRIAKAAGLIAEGIALLAESSKHDVAERRRWLGDEAECMSAISELRRALHVVLRAVVAHNTALVTTHGET